jgi:hypothetical protein
MSWSLIEEAPSRETEPFNAPRKDEFTGTTYTRTSTKTIALSVWRHHPCGKMAVGRGGDQPGECLWCKSTSPTKDQDRRGRK